MRTGIKQEKDGKKKKMRKQTCSLISKSLSSPLFFSIASFSLATFRIASSAFVRSTSHSCISFKHAEMSYPNRFLHWILFSKYVSSKCNKYFTSSTTFIISILASNSLIRFSVARTCAFSDASETFMSTIAYGFDRIL